MKIIKHIQGWFAADYLKAARGTGRKRHAVGAKFF
jgi:hypothetical protein